MEKQKEMELELVDPENGTKLVPNKDEETDKSKDLFVLYVHTGCEEDRKYILNISKLILNGNMLYVIIYAYIFYFNTFL